MQRFAMQFGSRNLAVGLKFPGKDSSKIFVVADGFTLRRLMLFPEMRAARFVAGERVGAHQLGKLEEISHPPGSFERLIEVLAVARHAHFAPESLPQLGDFSKRVFKPCPVPRHSAFVPQEQAKLPMNRIE